MGGDPLSARLEEARRRLEGLRGAVLAGAPWPLAERFDHAPEAVWGPPEVLAHLAEMLPYWLGEAERLIDAGERPVAFGRLPTEAVRVAIIERDRAIPVRELLARVDDGIDRWRCRWAELGPAERASRGHHPTRGLLTVADVADRFVASHLEEHVSQLEATLADRPA